MKLAGSSADRTLILYASDGPVRTSVWKKAPRDMQGSPAGSSALDVDIEVFREVPEKELLSALGNVVRKLKFVPPRCSHSSMRTWNSLNRRSWMEFPASPAIPPFRRKVHLSTKSRPRRRFGLCVEVRSLRLRIYRQHPRTTRASADRAPTRTCEVVLQPNIALESRKHSSYLNLISPTGQKKPVGVTRPTGF